MGITRLAPSPTGALHLGNARTFLINWFLARQNGWKILLRIEDIDGPRVKHDADRQAIDDLQWLQLSWDSGPIYQSTRQLKYSQAISSLIGTGLAYPCTCSRKETEAAASAPHAEDGSVIYPGTCRGRYSSIEDALRQTGKLPAVRFAVSDESVHFDDQFSGYHQFDVSRQLGDFVIRKGDGTPAYQLAVVVDDVEAGVTDIVRGDDLLDSTPRQILLYRALGFEDRIPNYYHIPLVVGIDGRRLAKRHGDTRLSHYRDKSVAASRVLALMARWCGIDSPDSIELPELLARFRLDAVSRNRIVFTNDDHAWLEGC